MKEFQEILDGIRQNTAKAEFLINRVQDHKDMLKQLKEDNGWFGAPFIVKFPNDKEFMIPSNYNLSIFKNIIESAIEIEVEKMTTELEDILCINSVTRNK
jgi:hypothetical protein